MWVTPKEKKTNLKENNKRTDEQMREGEKILRFFFFSSSFLRFTKIEPSEFVGQNTKIALRDEGYT